MAANFLSEFQSLNLIRGRGGRIAAQNPAYTGALEIFFSPGGLPRFSGQVGKAASL